MSKTQRTGQYTEQAACDFLVEHGLKCIERNYRCLLGEIDLIMLDRNELSFVEVRYRKDQNFGGALESITSFKQKKWLRAVQFYLKNKYPNNNFPYRFDVVAMTGPLQALQIEWVKNITMVF